MSLSMKSFVVCLVVASFAGCASTKKVETAEKKETPAAATTPAPQKAELMKEEAPKKELKAKNAKKSEPKMAAAATGAGLSCSSGSDTRTLEAKTTEAGGCELHYTKMGNSSIVATQISGSEKCNEVQEKIKSNLEGAGFQCAN